MQLCHWNLFLITLTVISSLVCNSDQHTKLENYLIQPEVNAFLDTIAYAEGTMNEDAYKLCFGYDLFDDFTDHPRRVNCYLHKGQQLCSSAAGKYQISSRMWDAICRKTNMEDFSPKNQDRAAVYLLMDAGALNTLKKKGFYPALKRVKHIWASMPGAPYKQPTKRKKELLAFYKKRLKFHKIHARKKRRKRT